MQGLLGRDGYIVDAPGGVVGVGGGGVAEGDVDGAAEG